MDNPEAVEVPKTAAAEKKGGAGKIILMVLTVVLVGGAAVAGALFGPKLLHAQQTGPPEAAPAAEEHAETAEEPEAEGETPETEAPASGNPGATASFASLVVDIRSREGELHHLKVVLSFELYEKFTEEEFKKWTPRGRQTALMYLRGLDYEGATDPKRFEVIRKELTEKVKASMGKNHVRRVLVTDFVAQ
jgi:flagellar basal body-associated protein FliL